MDKEAVSALQAASFVALVGAAMLIASFFEKDPSPLKPFGALGIMLGVAFAVRGLMMEPKKATKDVKHTENF